MLAIRSARTFHASRAGLHGNFVIGRGAAIWRNAGYDSAVRLGGPRSLPSLIARRPSCGRGAAVKGSRAARAAEGALDSRAQRPPKMPPLRSRTNVTADLLSLKLAPIRESGHSVQSAITHISQTVTRRRRSPRRQR